MYHAIQFALQLLVFSLVRAQGVPGESTDSPLSDVPLTEETGPEDDIETPLIPTLKRFLATTSDISIAHKVGTAEICGEITESFDEHPYFTSIISTYFDGDESLGIIKTKERYGIILAASYVLSQPDYFLDHEVTSNYTVEVLADRSRHEAKHEKNWTLPLFNLSNPIEPGSHQGFPIEIPDASDAPKPGDDVNVVSLHYDRQSSKYGVVVVKNVTLIDKQDCKSILSDVTTSLTLAEECKDSSLFLQNLKQSCDDSVVLKIMLENGRVVGLYETSISTKDGRKVEVYLDLAHQKDDITELESVQK